MTEKHCKSYIDGTCVECDRLPAKVIQAEKKYDCEDIIGQFIGAERYDILVEDDCDFYAPSLDGSRTEQNIIFKYRKHIFTPEECELAYAGLKEAAQETQNRGDAAGPRGQILISEKRGGREWVTDYQREVLKWLQRPDNVLDDGQTLQDIQNKYKNRDQSTDTRGQVWLRSKVIDKLVKDETKYFGWFDRWVDDVMRLSRNEQRKDAAIIESYISVTNYAQGAMSGIAGYYDRYPRYPYGRPTSYTEKSKEDFEKSFPYLRKLDQCFRNLLPERWTNQRKAADKLDPKFVIDSTVFTTLTINYNWRTACHRDASDLPTGFSNISAVGRGWQGAEFILPEYRVAVKLEPGDLLLVNNHEGIHANEALIGDDNDRLSIVAYFREPMLDLGSYEYEATRRKYVDERRYNKEHPLQRHLWNGISQGMWEEKEWYDWLRNQPNGEAMLKEYHPEAVVENSLENFF